MAPAHSTPQVETIKQYSGMVTVQRRVKDFPQLQAAGQRVDYQDEAIECAVRHKFSAHHKAWQPLGSRGGDVILMSLPLNQI